MSIADSPMPRQRGVVSTRRLCAFSLFFFLQPIHLLILANLFHPMRPETLFWSGSVSLLVYSFLLFDEYFRDRFAVTPFLLYLFLSWIRIGLVPVYLAFAVGLGYENEILFAGHDMSAYLVPGLFVEVLGDWFFVAGYYFLRSNSARLAPLRFSSPNVDSRVMVKGAVFLLALTYGVRAAAWVGLPTQALGQPLSILDDFGAPAAIMMLVFAIGKARASDRGSVILFTAVIFLLELSLALTSYGKTATILVALPLFIFYATRLRTARRKAGVRLSFKRGLLFGGVGFFCISVLFTYSGLRRPDFRDGGELLAKRPEVGSYLLEAVKASIPGTETFNAVQNFPRGGLWSFFHRNNLVDNDAWCYVYVQQNGTNRGKYLREVPAVLIPRVLWPEKPLVAVGKDIAVLLGQAESPESATTNTGFSMAGSLYFGYGFPCVVLGMFLNGVMFFVLWKLFSPSINVNPFATLVCVSLFLMGVRWHEGAFDGNIVRYTLLLILFLPLSKIKLF